MPIPDQVMRDLEKYNRPVDVSHEYMLYLMDPTKTQWTTLERTFDPSPSSEEQFKFWHVKRHLKCCRPGSIHCYAPKSIVSQAEFLAYADQRVSDEIRERNEY